MVRLKVIVVAIAIVALSGVSGLADEFHVWFGSTRNNVGQPQGIYHATFDTEKGVLSKAKLALELNSAGWITWHPTESIIYSSARIDGKFSICSIKVGLDRKLTLLQTVPLKHSATHLTTDQTGSLLIAAQYGGGSVVSLPIDEAGMLGEEVQLLQHEGGSKVVKGRQDNPHPHYAQVSPDNRWVYVPDLGLDQLVVYEIDADAKVRTQCGPLL